ncbi:MAG: radical SAM protein [Ignavibacteriae bacterium]|nr:MAG: radical SAM protein [Ignavibacteriota bacterium]
MMIKSAFKKINVKFYPRKLFYGPEWIVLGVNNLCNLHCKMCDVGTGYESSNFYHHLMGSHPVNMPLELIRKIINETALYFPKAKLGYAFTEPSIYPHLIESLEYAKKKGLFTALTTNGLNLSKLAGKLVNAGLNELNVSLDGIPEIHNKIRGHVRSFESAFEGLKQISAQAKGNLKIAVYCTITEWNYDSLAEFVMLFKDIPLKEIGFMHTNYTTGEIMKKHNEKFGNSYPASESSMDGINISNMDINVLQREIEKIKQLRPGFKITFAPEIYTVDELNSFYFEPGKSIGKICNDSFRNIMVKSDGTVIPSHGRCYKVTAGNIYNNNIKEIWNSAAISTFRKTLIKEGGLLPACSRCCSAF